MTTEQKIILDKRTIQRIHRLTALITLAAILFYLFFQVNKGGPFRQINPFGVDPYVAVGSFVFQGARLVGVLTYARALRLWELPGQATRARLILRGDLLVLVCTIALVTVFGRIQTAASPPDLTPAGGIDDLWRLVRVPVAKVGAHLPRAVVAWVAGFNSDWLFARLQWINPRPHPWRFACALGLVVGIGLVLAQLPEGLPPSLRTGLIVMGVFISAELAATLLGFAIFGGYLGLRPVFNIKALPVRLGKIGHG